MPYDMQDPQLSKKIAAKTANTAFGIVEYVDVGAGPVVLCLHGAMGGYDQSLLLAQTIGIAGYRYLCVSRPGYLGTPLTSGRSSEQQAELIAALLDSLGITRAGVIAVSGGGPCAIQFGLRHPEMCKGLVLVSTYATKVDTKIPVSFKVMTYLARWSWFVDRFRKNAERDLESVAKRSIRDPHILAGAINDKDIWPLFSALLVSTYDKMGHRLVGTKNDIEISRTASYRLENLKVPVLIIHGTQDPLLQFEIHARIFESQIPNAELLAVDGGEHVAIFTHRKLVGAKVNEFMQSHFQSDCPDSDLSSG
ncbi:alpha/beta fold hydrolase [Desulfomonile tiedjei]|uniref:Putative hydrolase or acyltransferase of alpha/beta superfamily n=1 Tax=Desulfomonile tiedjei (strain ATCC 49306 / DSM 6799 / DCB-1) TaxID=706587 RepID=I4CF55_DESTA|nr:alpha/beta hydrolase [Desulfomonile tiedjei]AFM28196.1 putative hydrolase or acyltransferase of alpha/beta superfamily [Desulfomonile tiedjei DSM 6799]